MTGRSVIPILLLFCGLAIAESAPAAKPRIPAHSKVFLAPMDGFENNLRDAIKSKDVPLEVVADKAQAQYEITGHSTTVKASTAKKAIMWNWHSDEDAAISVTDLKSSEVVYAYEVHKQSSAHGKRSTAEACAKHLKDDAISGK